MNALGWVQVAASVLLVIITGIYVYLTKRILESTDRQAKLAWNPVIGIRLGNMPISAVFGPSRRNLSIGLNLVNVGNAPAVDVLVDGEILLGYSRIEGENVIPARFEPSSISFMRPGEELSEHDRHDLSFGNRCIVHLLDDFRECERLNIHRIETDPYKEPFTSAKLRVCIYYRNNVGQWFESRYETHVDLPEVPADDESAELRQIYRPRPKFHAGPLSEQEVDWQISSRNDKRRLCGW